MGRRCLGGVGHLVEVREVGSVVGWLSWVGATAETNDCPCNVKTCREKRREDRSNMYCSSRLIHKTVLRTFCSESHQPGQPSAWLAHQPRGHCLGDIEIAFSPWLISLNPSPDADPCSLSKPEQTIVG